MIIDRHTSFFELIFYKELIDVDSQIMHLFDILKDYPVPEEYNMSLNELKFKQLNDLQSRIKTFDDLIFVSFEVIYELNKESVLQLSAFDCIRFGIFIKDELDRITNLFKAIEYKPSNEEMQAGISNLNHGFMGTIDWYARRMGYKDHDEVTELKWVRIYKCLKIDHDNNKFNRDYRKVIEHQNKMRNGRR